MQSIESLRHACPERAGFQITRKNGHPMHTFLHFFGSVELLANGKVIQTEPHACILYGGSPDPSGKRLPCMGLHHVRVQQFLLLLYRPLRSWAGAKP